MLINERERERERERESERERERERRNSQYWIKLRKIIQLITLH